MVLMSHSDIAFSDAKQLLAIGWLQRVIWKKKMQSSTIVLLQNYKVKSKRIVVVLKCKKMFLFEKIDKNVQFNSVSRNSLNSRFCPREAGGFFIGELKKVRLKQCPFYSFCFRDA